MELISQPIYLPQLKHDTFHANIKQIIILQREEKLETSSITLMYSPVPFPCLLN